MSLYPLKFYPILKERIWGGNKLSSILEKHTSSNSIGESWEISGVKGNISTISMGNLKDLSLNDIINKSPESILGKSVVQRFGKDFPILIKFIDAKTDLSIQVHPDDKLAKSRHHSFGKTEMWHILQADKNANLIIGFNENISQNTYLNYLKDNNLNKILNYVPAKKGDTFFIPAGKIHAIGGGILLAEIQQTSDITYRIYDYNRTDTNGNMRELHTEQALSAIDYSKKDDFIVDCNRKKNIPSPMVGSPYFITNYLDFDKSTNLNIKNRDSFTVLICLDGSGIIENNFGETSIKKGETILLSASSHYISIKTLNSTFLEVHL